MLNSFFEIAMIILLALGVSLVMRLLRQPLIIGHILTGILVSPYVFDLIHSQESFQLFSHIGVAILLFMVGLNLNPKAVKEVGKVSLITGIGQIVFTSLFGYLIAKAFGFGNIESLYIAVALTFSSTIIILKLLSDKGDLHTLYGKISVGFLIVQDLAVILIMMSLSALQTGDQVGSLVLFTLLKGVGVLALLYLLSRFVLPYVENWIASSQELLLLFSMAWCFALASLFNYLNFSVEAGALLAGITLSTNNFRFEIAAKLKPLRDFFIVIFFIVLGSQLTFTTVQDMIVPAIVFSLFVLIGNPLIVMALMGLLGYRKLTSFRSGLTVAQISEFSLIFVTLGVSLGHVRYEVLSFVTIIGLITIALSSYMILYAETLYKFLAPVLGIFERSRVIKRRNKDRLKPETILFGFDGIGEQVLSAFKKNRKNVVVVDYDPNVITSVSKKRYTAIFGDASNIETLEELDLRHTKMIISTIDSDEINIFLIKYVREHNQKAIILTACMNPDKAMELYDAGASFVMIPQHIGGNHISGLIEKHGFNEGKYIKEKIEHMKHLRKRKKK